MSPLWRPATERGSGLFNVIWLKSIHTFTFIVTVFTASASICISARNASLYIAVMIFCAQPYLKPCFMCPFYILSTCPSKGLCTAQAKTSWSLLFSSTRIYGPPQWPMVQSPSAAGCRTMMFCQPRPRSLRIYCPTHADLSLLADMRDTAPRPTKSCWTWSLVW